MLGLAGSTSSRISLLTRIGPNQWPSLAVQPDRVREAPVGAERQFGEVMINSGRHIQLDLIVGSTVSESPAPVAARGYGS